jgi:hypothetical protein
MAASSTWTRQNSVSESSLQHLLPDRENFNSAALSLTFSSAEYIGRSITPVSELNSAIVVEARPISQKPNVDIPDYRPQYDYSRRSTSESLESPFSLPPPPRATRSPVARRPTIETISSVLPSGDQWSSADLGGSFRGHSRGGSTSSVSTSQRGSFGVRLLPALPKEQPDVSGRRARHPSDSSLRSARKTPMSSPHVSISSVASASLPPTSPSPAAASSLSDDDVNDSHVAFSSSLPTLSRVRHQPQVPSDVSKYDYGSAPVSVAFGTIGYILHDELSSPTTTVSPGGLTPPVWDTLAADVAISNSTSLMQRRPPSRDADDRVLRILAPHTAPSTALPGRPLTPPGIDLTHAPSNVENQHYV